MQVAEAENNGARKCNADVLCEVNEWIGEWRTAGRVNQCMRLRVDVMLCVRDRCRSNLWVLLCCCSAIVGLVDRSDRRYGDAKARCSRLGLDVVFVPRWVCNMQDRARRLCVESMLRSAQQCRSQEVSRTRVRCEIQAWCRFPCWASDRSMAPDAR
jgi:hypothetical protein